ncbi:hypothetical protein ACFLU6_02755 [Acidobacteriota bacterium]
MAAKETPEQRFVRLATNRTQKILDDIRRLANLASPHYKYSAEQIAKMFDAIQEDLSEAKQCFEEKLDKVQKKFSFGE